MLKLTGITKRFGTNPALKGVDLQVRKGELFGLLGPNGAGKSTLMSVLSGYLFPDAGTIELDGQLVDPRSNSWRSRIGLVPQQLALWEDLTAEANLEIFGGLLGVPRSKLSKRVTELLDAVRLADRRGDVVKTFSGGMKRRLNIAAALLHEPSLLLCDEPTVGVDPQSRNAIFEHLEHLHRAGLTVIYTTHYMEEASRLCERVAIIDGGCIAALGTEDELLDQLPFSEEVRIARIGCGDSQVEALRSFGEISRVEDAWTLRVREGMPLSQVVAGIERAGVDTRHLSVTRPNLENVFLHLTGKSLRE